MKRKYHVEFSPKYPPYQKEDEWHVVFYFSLGSISGGNVVEKFSTKEEAEKLCKKLNRESD